MFCLKNWYFWFSDPCCRIIRHTELFCITNLSRTPVWEDEGGRSYAKSHNYVSVFFLEARVCLSANAVMPAFIRGGRFMSLKQFPSDGEWETWDRDTQSIWLFFFSMTLDHNLTYSQKCLAQLRQYLRHFGEHPQYLLRTSSNRLWFKDNSTASKLSCVGYCDTVIPCACLERAAGLSALMELLDGKGILHVWAQLGLTRSPTFTSGK